VTTTGPGPAGAPSTEAPAPKTKAPKAPKAQGANNAGNHGLIGRCHALQQGSAQGRAKKAAHGRAFQGLNCQGVPAPAAEANDDSGD
jgi:hypothetical protein